jgi:cysteate synthase
VNNTYSLLCSGDEFAKPHVLHDTGINNVCSKHKCLLRIIKKDKISFRKSPHLDSYQDFLPIKNNTFNYILKSVQKPEIYKAEKLGKKLNISRLYFSITGYAPALGIKIPTSTFKILESCPVVTRHFSYGFQNSPIVLASEGNTGNAFIKMAVDFDLKLVLVCPFNAQNRFKYLCEKNKSSQEIVSKIKKNIRFITTGEKGDYADSIALAAEISKFDGYIAEGGAYNPARRYGMGFILTSFVEKIHKLPDHYFQAIGSGTGMISIENMKELLVKHNFVPNKNITYHFSQNAPFTPVVSAWEEKRRKIIEEKDMKNPKKLIKEIYAYVLSNRNPAYSVQGGLFDVFSKNDAYGYAVTNNDIKKVQQLVHDYEGLEIGYPSAVAIASLIQAVSQKRIPQDSSILVNLTEVGTRKAEEVYTTIHIIDKIQPCIINSFSKGEKASLKKHLFV